MLSAINVLIEIKVGKKYGRFKLFWKIAAIKFSCSEKYVK